MCSISFQAGAAQADPSDDSGQRLRGQYYPLSMKQLEWQLSLNAGVKEVQREHARITQIIHTLSFNYFLRKALQRCTNYPFKTFGF